MLTATIRLDLDRDYVLSDLQSTRDGPLTMSQCEVVGDDEIKFVIEAGEDRAAIERTLRGNDAVRSVESVDDHRLLVTKRSSGAVPIIRENHGMLEQLSKFEGTVRVFDVVVFDRDAVRRIIAGLRDLGDVRLLRLTRLGDETTGLSPRQKEVIELALEAGYFDWPREVDAETLADRLGIAHATLLEHLRKAEKKILTDALNRATTPGTSVGADTDREESRDIKTQPM